VRRPQLAAAAASLTVLALAASGCGGSSDTSPSPAASSASPTESATPTPTPTPTPVAVPTATLTGLPGADGPALIVKIDNAPAAQPHAGLTQADVVYVEEVEGGITRLAVVFSSQVPDLIGPVRSARLTDLTLFEPYATPAFAFSGANATLRKQIRSADLIDLGADRLSKVQYFRKKGWSAPHNLFADGSELIALSGAAGRPPADPGWVFAAAPPPGGRPVSAVAVKYPGTSATLTWSAAEDRWLVAMGGGPMRTVEGPQLGPKTAVVQYAKVERSGAVDVSGNSSPFVQTVGSGKALILRDGRAYDAAWTRATPQEPIRYTAPDGSPLPFDPGQVWVLLARPELPAAETPAA
jgi:hypothetical protein